MIALSDDRRMVTTMSATKAAKTTSPAETAWPPVPPWSAPRKPAKSGADRQRAYRERMARKDRGSAEPVTVLLTEEARAALAGLAERNSMSQRMALDLLLRDAWRMVSTAT